MVCLTWYLLITSMIYLGSWVYSFVDFLQRETEIERDSHFVYAFEIHMLTLFHSLIFVGLAIYVTTISMSKTHDFDGK